MTFIIFPLINLLMLCILASFPFFSFPCGTLIFRAVLVGFLFPICFCSEHRVGEHLHMNLFRVFSRSLAFVLLWPRSFLWLLLLQLFLSSSLLFFSFGIALYSFFLFFFPLGSGQMGRDGTNRCTKIRKEKNTRITHHLRSSLFESINWCISYPQSWTTLRGSHHFVFPLSCLLIPPCLCVYLKDRFTDLVWCGGVRSVY